MSRFDRYLLSQLTVTFGFFALILIAVYWVNRAVRLFDRLISDGQTAWVFLEFTALTLPNVILLVLPIAAFVAATYVTNRLISESEIVIVQASGWSAFRMSRAAVVFGIGVFLLMSLLAHYLVPLSRTEMSNRQIEIDADVTAGLFREGTFIHPSRGITFFVGELSERGEMLNVFLVDDRAPDTETTYQADKAILIGGEGTTKLIMFDGTTQTLRDEGQRLSRVEFSELSYDLSALAEENAGQNGTGTRALREFPTLALLRADPADLAWAGATPQMFMAEAQARFAHPLLALAFSVIAVSTLFLGSFSRFGVSRQILGAVILVIALQMLFNTADKFARTGEAHWIILYAPVLLGLGISAGMLFLAGRPGIFRRFAGAAS